MTKVARRIIQVAAIFTGHRTVRHRQLPCVVVAVIHSTPVESCLVRALVALVVDVLVRVENDVQVVVQIRPGQPRHAVKGVGDITRVWE